MVTKSARLAPRNKTGACRFLKEDRIIPGFLRGDWGPRNEYLSAHFTRCPTPRIRDQVKDLYHGELVLRAELAINYEDICFKDTSCRVLGEPPRK